MASRYKGLYVERDSAGRINSVWVEDDCGIPNCLPPGVYLEREIKPRMELLPDKDAHRSL